MVHYCFVGRGWLIGSSGSLVCGRRQLITSGMRWLTGLWDLVAFWFAISCGSLDFGYVMTYWNWDVVAFLKWNMVVRW